MDNIFIIRITLLKFNYMIIIIIPTANEVEGVYWFHFVRPSVHLSVDQIVSAVYLPQY